MNYQQEQHLYCDEKRQKDSGNGTGSPLTKILRTPLRCIFTMQLPGAAARAWNTPLVFYTVGAITCCITTTSFKKHFKRSLTPDLVVYNF